MSQSLEDFATGFIDAWDEEITGDYRGLYPRDMAYRSGYATGQTVMLLGAISLGLTLVVIGGWAFSCLFGVK